MYMRAVRSWVIIGKNLREADQSDLLRFISEKSKNIYAILRYPVPVCGRMQIKAAQSILGASTA